MELSRAKRSQTPLSVFFIDLNLFELVNDRCGHLVGEDVLLRVANKVSRAVREYDHVADAASKSSLWCCPTAPPKQHRKWPKEFGSVFTTKLLRFLRYR